MTARRRLARTIGGPVLAVAIALACGLSNAANASVAQAVPATPHELTQADVSAFLDGYLPVEMDRAAINGVTIAIVKDGRLLYAHGYGVADRANHVPVSADTTLFRIGSISKLFMWTAVMQLVEQHRIDLDADVRQYLDFTLPLRDGKPLTMRQLMTHTPGFEETVRDMWAREGGSLDLRDYLVHHVPARIFAPGTVVAYSNYGAALAGYIVQRVSGEPFDAYVQHHVTGPLGMAHTTFAQPLPPALAPSMSRGYLEGADEAKPFELIRVAPAGSVSASATDMARFMIANLGDGSIGNLDGQRILQPATLAQMQSPQRWSQPRGPASALGFWEDSAYGTHIIGHGGDSEWFHSGLYLLPSQHVGVFVSQNSLGKRVLRGQLMRRFMERYFPAPATVFPAGRPAASETDGLAGTYMSSRRNESGPLYLAALLGQTTVHVDADGVLTIAGMTGLDDRTVKFRSLGHGAWQSPDDSTRRLYFDRDAAGQWQLGYHEPVEVEQHSPWTRDSRLMRATLGLSLFVMIATLLAWPVAAMIRRHHDVLPPADPREQRARRWLRLCALLVVLPWATLFVPLALVGNGSEVVMTSPCMLDLLRLVQATAWLAVVALPLAAWAAVRGASARGVWWGSRIHAVLVLLATIGGLFMAWTGHLLIGTTSL